MTLWAIVPVKPLRRGKSRLAGVLSESERTQLNRNLLANTLENLTGVEEIEQVLVISRDQAALSLARENGARTILEVGAPHLNVALTRATAMARSASVHRILILPADLPQITQDDIQSILKAGEEPPVVVIAPDHNREGTNALLINPPGLISYDFGEGSFERHSDLTRQAGAELKICELASFANDVDLPEDLEFLDTKFIDMQPNANN